MDDFHVVVEECPESESTRALEALEGLDFYKKQKGYKRVRRRTMQKRRLTLVDISDVLVAVLLAGEWFITMRAGEWPKT